MIRTGATKAQIRPSWIEIQQLKKMQYTLDKGENSLSLGVKDSATK